MSGTEAEAARLYAMNAAGWANAAAWEDLGTDAQRIWLEFAERRMADRPPSAQPIG